MKSRGNAFIYILIAVVLFGLLTFSLMRNTDVGGANNDISSGRDAIAASAIIDYAASAQSAITQLDRIGTTTDQLDFIQPSEAAFNTAPTLAKLFHPDGGGLVYKALPDAVIDPAYTGPPTAGYYVGRFNNVEWTPTAAQDVIFAAFGLTQNVCAAINKKLRNDTTIPAYVGGVSLKGALVDTTYHGTGNGDFIATSCAGCDEKAALCVSAGTTYAFYQILVPR